MAQKRTIDIDINTNADQAAKEFDNLSKATKVANDSLEGLNKTFEEANGDIQPLTARMGEAEDRLYELALAGDTTSKEYQGLLNKVGEYRKVQIQTDLAVDGAAQTLSQKLGSALGGATSSFAATQGAMALFGNENEALEKSLLKVQAALAIQQGIDGLRTSMKELSIGTKIATKTQALFAFVTSGTTSVLKTLRGALVGLGIGLLVVGLVALIENFDKVTATIKNALSFALKPLKKAIDAVVDAYYAVTDALGITDTEAEKLAQNQKRRAEEETKRNQETIKQNKALGAERRRQFIAEKKRIETLKRLKQEEFDLNIALLESEGKNTIRLRKQRAKELLDEAKENEEIQRRGGLMNFGLFNKAREKRIKAQILFNNISRELREANAAKEEQEEKIEFDGKIERLQIQAATEVSIDKEKNEQIAKNAAEARERQKAADQAERDRLIRNKEFAISTTEDTLSLISDITELFGKKGEKQAKRAFNVQKAAQIAGASIETFRSAQSAYLSQFLPIPDPSSPVRGGVAAGIAVAAGLTNVAKIASQKFEGGGASGGSSFSGGSVGGGEQQAPSFNVVGDSGINQLAQLQQAPVQAFVVSGEVTTSQALDRNRVENATL